MSKVTLDNMQYLSGIYALNLDCPELGTPGDWHYGSVDWPKAPLTDSFATPYGDWGITEREVPGRGVLPVANHLRASLDLIALGYYSSAQGMREEFLIDETLTPIVFDKVWELKDSESWSDIDRFMGREYTTDWLDFKESKGVPTVPTILKMELPFGCEVMAAEKTTLINDIKVDEIDKLFQKNVMAYLTHGKLRDLYDITYLLDVRFNDLSKVSVELARSAFEHKDLSQFDYLVRTQNDPLIDKDILETRFLAAYDALGLLVEKKEPLQKRIEAAIEKSAEHNIPPAPDVSMYDEDIPF